MSKQWGHGYHKGYADAQKKDGALIGLFFHSYKNGEINWQGQIVEKLTGENYLVQLFSWIDGRPTEKKIIKSSELIDFRFYDSAEEWKLVGDRALLA